MIENSSYYQELASHPMPEHVDDCVVQSGKKQPSNLSLTAVKPHGSYVQRCFLLLNLQSAAIFLSLMNLAHTCQVFQDDHFLFLSLVYKILRELSGL